MNCLRRAGHTPSANRKIASLLAVCVLLACGVVGIGALRRRPPVGPTTRIDDLRVPAAEILALSPDVWKIDVLVPAAHPTHRIIQIADVHYFPREDFQNNRYPPSDEAYYEYARNVEELQETELRLLRWLVDNHGLNEAFSEGLWQEDLPRVCQHLSPMREWSASRAEILALAARLRGDIDDAEARGNDAAPLRAHLRQAEAYAEWGLRCGAVTRLVASRPSVRLLPAEDKDVADRGALGVGMMAREVAIVRNLLSRSKCAVIVLGTLHDLSEHVKQLGGGRCEYVRVIPNGLAECQGLTDDKDWPIIRQILEAKQDTQPFCE